ARVRYRGARASRRSSSRVGTARLYAGEKLPPNSRQAGAAGRRHRRQNFAFGASPRQGRAVPEPSTLGRLALEALRVSVIAGAALSLEPVEPQLVAALHTARGPLVDGVGVAPAPQVLRAPRDVARPDPALPAPEALGRGQLRAEALQFHSRVYTRPSREASTAGL